MKTTHSRDDILTAFLGWSVPSGSYSNGALDAIITPTIAYGKGFGHFDAQGTFGVALPTADTNIIGRTYAWNNTFQYHLLRKVWPEVELNSSFFQDGKNDGKSRPLSLPAWCWEGFTGVDVGGSRSAAASRSPQRTSTTAITTEFCRYDSRSERFGESARELIPWRRAAQARKCWLDKRGESRVPRGGHKVLAQSLRARLRAR